MARKIKIKGREFNIEWNAAAYFRFSKFGGDSAALGKTDAAEAFANSVILLWAMFDKGARVEFPNPESTAELMLPAPDAEALAQINAEIIEGNTTIGIGE